MDNKGQASGFAWIIALLFLFILGLGFIVMNQTLEIHVLPTANDLINDSPYLNSTEKEDVKDDNDKYMAYWKTMPYIITFILVLFVIVTAYRKGSGRYYG